MKGQTNRTIIERHIQQKLRNMPCAGVIDRIGLFPAGCNARRKLRRVVILTQAICNAAVRPPGKIEPDNYPRARHNMTDAEIKVWQRLRGRQLAGCKFRRQHPFLDYVLDFVCLERRLIVEVDGGQHLENERDKMRDKHLQAAGFQILRFWNNEVLQDIDAVVEVIWIALQKVSSAASKPHPLPSPPLEGEGAAFPRYAALPTSNHIESKRVY